MQEYLSSLLIEVKDEVQIEMSLNTIISEVINSEVEYMSEHLFDEWRAMILDEQRLEDQEAYRSKFRTILLNTNVMCFNLLMCVIWS